MAEKLNIEGLSRLLPCKSSKNSSGYCSPAGNCTAGYSARLIPVNAMLPRPGGLNCGGAAPGPAGIASPAPLFCGPRTVRSASGVGRVITY